MTQLNDEVRQVVDAFMKSGELFTALDVSNKVKLTNPFARHGEVRDVVRDLFTSVMQQASWARSPIAVTLPDGTQQTALLYHPLSDAWDLDTKYDDQKRAQASLKPGAQVPPATVVPATNPTSVFGWCGTPPPGTVTTPVVLTAVKSKPAPAPVKDLPARDRWVQLFNSQPSLFPLK